MDKYYKSRQMRWHIASSTNLNIIMRWKRTPRRMAIIIIFNL